MKRAVNIGRNASITAQRVYLVLDAFPISRIIDGIGEWFGCNDTAVLDCNDVPARSAEIEGFDLSLA